MNILYEKTAEGSIDEVGAKQEEAAQNHKFGVLGIIDLKAKMTGKGVEFGPECRIYEVCKPQRAKQPRRRCDGLQQGRAARERCSHSAIHLLGAP